MATLKKSTPHKHTHNRLTALFPGPSRWAGTRKVKPIWILLKQVCTLLQTDNHTSTPPLCFFTGQMPFLQPNQPHQSTEEHTMKKKIRGAIVVVCVTSSMCNSRWYLDFSSKFTEAGNHVSRLMNLAEHQLGLFKQRMWVRPSVAWHRTAETVVLLAEVDVDSADVGDELARTELKLIEVLHLEILLFRPHLECYVTDIHTHTCLTALFPGLPAEPVPKKVKPIWILLKQETVSGSGISWVICKSAPRSRQITTPAPHHLVFLQALPAAQPTASKHWRLIYLFIYLNLNLQCFDTVVWAPGRASDL